MNNQLLSQLKNNPNIILAATIVLYLLILVSLVLITVYIVKKKRDAIVDRGSKKCHALISLNSRYDFNELSIYKIKHRCKSKHDFDIFEPIIFFKGIIFDDQEWVKERIALAEENRSLYNEYYEKYEKIWNYEYDWKTIKGNKDLAHYDAKWFKERENRFLKENILSPELDVNIEIAYYYSSPGGRNHYYDSELLTLDDCQNAMAAIQNRKDYEASKKYQRTIMTNSLRYDVMKRDGFRCTLCGCSADEGVKLHVDHILPVAKGGKTEMSNLRTLCDRCNSGKRDKYDYDGYN